MAILRAYLTLSGICIDFNHVEQELGLKANVIRHREEVLWNGRSFGNDEWCIDTGQIISGDIAEVIQILLSKCSSLSGKMKDLALKNTAKWSVLFLVDADGGEFPVMIIPVQFLSFSSIIEADIAFDIYS